MIGKYLSLCLMLVSLPAWAACDDWPSNFSKYQEVMPSYDDNGAVEAVVVFSRAEFSVSKSSLIETALREAELKARRAFSEFLETEVSSLTELERGNVTMKTDAGESVDSTDFSAVRDYMQANSKSVQSGVRKLDSCVDEDEKRAFILLGWDMASMAGSGRASLVGANVNSLDLVPPHEITKAQGYRKKSALKDDF